MEKTLSIVKPDGVEKNVIGEVIRRFESKDIKVVGIKMVKLSKEQAEGFYAVHKERPFFGSLTDFMSSGPCVLMVLEGENVGRLSQNGEKPAQGTDPAPSTWAGNVGRLSGDEKKPAQ